MRDTQQLCLDIIKGLQQSAEPVPGIDGRFHGLYIIVNQVNMKFYVGKHTRKFESLDKYFGSGVALNRAIEKHGAENFTMNYFQYCESAQEVHDKETELLQMLLDEVFQGSWTVLVKFCYNRKMNEGLNSYSDETREKMSELKTGELNPNFGRTGELHPNFGRTGELHPMFGKTGELTSMFGRNHSDETKAKMSSSALGRTGELCGNFKGITIGTNKESEVVAFNGGQDINSRPTRSCKFFNHGLISSVISGRKKTHAGFDKFFRTTSVDLLQHYLETATFYDEQSKLVLQNYLESVSVDA